MKLDTQMRDFAFNAIGPEAQRFERMGFNGVWTFEAAHDPFLPLGLAAAATERLHIGTNISVAFGRSPFAMAQIAWDLQKGSQGRFHLGLGTQVRAHVERRFSMPFEHPAARVADYILRARDLGHVSTGSPSHLRRAVLPVQAHESVLQSRTDRAPEHSHLSRGGESAHVPCGR